MPMKRSDRIRLESACMDLIRFLEWINQDNVSIVVDRGSDTLSGPINKQAGSKLQLASNALAKIQAVHGHEWKQAYSHIYRGK